VQERLREYKKMIVWNNALVQHDEKQKSGFSALSEFVHGQRVPRGLFKLQIVHHPVCVDKSSKAKKENKRQGAIDDDVMAKLLIIPTLVIQNGEKAKKENV
jgi:hypothetical protein